MKTTVLTNIAIRVDASTRMGIGHVMRCLTLARKLQQQNSQVFFLCKQHQGNLIAYIRQQKFKVFALSAPIENIEQQIDDKKWLGCTYQQDVQEVIQALKNTPWLDWLIVDHYSIDHHWQRLIKPLTNKIMVIDDLANRTHYCNVLLDQTLNRKKQAYQYLVPKHCRLLLGRDFMLLRDEFSQLRPLAKIKRENTKNINNVLVSIGGTDPDNITEQIIYWLIASKAYFPQIKVQVVISPESDYLFSIKQLITNHVWIKVIINPESMAKLMLDADLAIGSSGSTAWERCCLGLPTLTIVNAKNQQCIADNLNDAEAIINIGMYKNLTEPTFKKALVKLKKSSEIYNIMVKKCFACCDGSGSTNVIKNLSI